jgi:hypothetical protein
VQVVIALWAVCAAPCVTVEGQAAAAATRCKAYKAIASREDVIGCLFSSVDAKSNTSADGAVIAASISCSFPTQELFSCAVLLLL